MFEKVEAFYRPGNVREALRLLQSGKGQARVLAGGTDVVVEGDDSVRFLIDITHAGLSYMRRRGAASVIGATTTMADLEESEMARTLAGGLLSRAARTCGSVPIRNLATLGGNMANGSPAADMATPLLVLDAAVVMVDARGRQQIAAGGISGARAHQQILQVAAGGSCGPRSAEWQRLPLVVPETRPHGGGYLPGQCGRGTATGFPRPGEVGADRAGVGGADSHACHERGAAA